MPVLLNAVEGVINKIIAQDVRATRRAAELTGKVLAVHVTDWRWRCLVAVSDKSLVIAGKNSENMPADVTIAGRGVDLLALIASQGDRQSLQDGSVQISGSLSVARALQTLLAELAIDWEGLLAPLMGNTLAHEVSTAAKAGKRMLGRVVKKARQDTADMVHDEWGLAPYSMSVDDFFQQIEELRADTDRLWQRFQQRRAQQAHE